MKLMARYRGEGDDNDVVGEGGRCGWDEWQGMSMWVVTCGSGIVFNAADVLGMSVVCGTKGIGGACEMFMCLARGVVGGDGDEWI